MRWSLRMSAVTAALVLAATAGAATAEAAGIDATGSVKQVYATGPSPKQQLSLFDKKGRKVAAKRATALGGGLFRNVKPGAGYTVRATKGKAKSKALKVLSTKSAPPSTDIYKQDIPS